MKRRLNIHSRVSDSGSSTAAQKKLTKKQTAAQAARTQPTATSTPAPMAAPSTGSTARTLQTRIIAQEPTQETGSEEGQGSSGTQGPFPAEFRNKVKKEIRNKIMNVTEDQNGSQEDSETENEAKMELLESERRLLELQLKLAKIKKEKQARIMRRTTDKMTQTMSNSLASGLDQLEEAYEAKTARWREELSSREVVLISLDDSADQDEIAAIIAFSNEVSLNEDAEDEVIDNKEDMDHDASRAEPATRTKRK